MPRLFNLVCCELCVVVYLLLLLLLLLLFYFISRCGCCCFFTCVSTLFRVLPLLRLVRFVSFGSPWTRGSVCRFCWASSPPFYREYVCIAFYFACMLHTHTRTHRHIFYFIFFHHFNVYFCYFSRHFHFHIFLLLLLLDKGVLWWFLVLASMCWYAYLLF